MALPELKITVYSDYICPFCYVGHHRLQRLRDSYDLRINWCFLEIHPGTSVAGEPIDSLDYPAEQWQQMMANLKRVAKEENIPLSKLSFITNSKDALLLSEAAKHCGSKTFYELHEKLFSAYFVDSKNIGDRDVLNEVAVSCGIDKETIESAWTDEKYQKRLLENFSSARKHDIQSVPSFVFGDRVLTGVVAESTFREAAQQLLLASS
ncbi:MAG: DsbA family oxidoreductase [Gammaproteobacteria bacterium]|nr:MAG: DsbA family oxidoreductase [Gammaproteobacteria bacterium]